MKAICLSYDRNIRVLEFVIDSYRRLWPEHPFVFHVPYNENRPDELEKKFPGKVELLQTPRPIRETVEALIAGLDGNEWVWWCLDDKYLTGVKVEALDAVYRLVCETANPDIWGVMVTRNFYSSGRTVTSVFGSEAEPFLRKKAYNGFWQPHFVRVKILRKFLVDNELDDDSYVDRAGESGIMPKIDQLLVSNLPVGKKVFLASRTYLTFGETMTNGALTINCLEDMEAHSFKPPSLPRILSGWYTTFDGRVIKSLPKELKGSPLFIVSGPEGSGTTYLWKALGSSGARHWGAAIFDRKRSVPRQGVHHVSLPDGRPARWLAEIDDLLPKSTKFLVVVREKEFAVRSAHQRFGQGRPHSIVEEQHYEQALDYIKNIKERFSVFELRYEQLGDPETRAKIEEFVGMKGDWPQFSSRDI